MRQQIGQDVSARVYSEQRPQTEYQVSRQFRVRRLAHPAQVQLAPAGVRSGRTPARAARTPAGDAHPAGKTTAPILALLRRLNGERQPSPLRLLRPLCLQGRHAGHDLLASVIYSTRINLDWFNKYSQLVQALTQAQMNQIRAAGELSRYISRTSSEISDMMRQSYEQRQASQDRINKNWSQYMRGVDEYRDPVTGRPLELPSGYRMLGSAATANTSSPTV